MQKTCLITGINSKIGSRLADYLNRQNYQIIGTFYKENDLQNKYKNIHFIQLDQTKPEEFANEILEVCHEISFPDLIINNVSSFINDNFSNFTLENFDSAMNFNIKSMLKLLQEFSNLGKQFKLINMLDYFDNKIPTRNFFTYGFTKSALFNLTKSLAQTLAPKSVVNGIALGPLIIDETQSEKYFDKIKADNVLNKQVDFQDFIRTIDYLINCNSITGEVIHLDCGRNLRTNSDYF